MKKSKSATAITNRISNLSPLESQNEPEFRCGRNRARHISANARAVMRRYYRRKQGKVVLQVEVDEIALATALSESRLLDPNLADDRTALAEATARLLEIFCKEKS